MRRIILSIGVVLVLGALLTAGTLRYRDRQEEAGRYREILESEAGWILANQHRSGAIFWNLESSRNVNPYFACQAARGLLADEMPSPLRMEAVGRYIRWHFRYLNADGTMDDHRMETGGRFVSTGTRDSEDSYAAVFLSLLAEFREKGGTTEEADPGGTLEESVTGVLLRTTASGLSYNKTEDPVFYLMDNAEVYEALILSGYRTQGEMLAGQVEARLWKGSHYLPALDAQGREADFGSWETFYPFAVAQLFPLICGMLPEDHPRAGELYQRFSEEYPWETLKGYREEEGFYWSLLSYASARIGDRERTDRYIHNFRNEFSGRREYPWHTAESGWIMRACAERIRDLQGLW